MWVSGGKCQDTTQFVFYESMSDSNYRRRVFVPIMEAGVTRIATSYYLNSLSLIRQSCLHSPKLKSAFEHPLWPGANVARYWAGNKLRCRARKGRVKELGRYMGNRIGGDVSLIT